MLDNGTDKVPPSSVTSRLAPFTANAVLYSFPESVSSSNAIWSAMFVALVAISVVLVTILVAFVVILVVLVDISVVLVAISAVLLAILVVLVAILAALAATSADSSNEDRSTSSEVPFSIPMVKML